MSHVVAYTLSDIYIRRADKCNSVDDMVDMLGEMFLDYTQRMNEIKKGNAASIHIRRCINYIYEHLQEKLTVRKAAEYLGLSPAYISRLFMKETGMGFREFILNAKINTAKNMIAKHSLSFLEISLSLGFSSQSAFITSFKKLTGKRQENSEQAAAAFRACLKSRRTLIPYIFKKTNRHNAQNQLSPIGKKVNFAETY